MKKPLPPGWIIAGFAICLVGLWAVLSFFVFANPPETEAQPASVMGVPRNTVGAEKPVKKGNEVSPSPMNKVSSDPKNDSESEWRLVASLDVSEREAEIAELEARVVRENAIHRLNVGEVSDVDRKEYGRIFARIVELKSVALKEEISDLTAKAHAIESAHARRLTAAGIDAKTPARSH